MELLHGNLSVIAIMSCGLYVSRGYQIRSVAACLKGWRNKSVCGLPLAGVMRNARVEWLLRGRIRARVGASGEMRSAKTGGQALRPQARQRRHGFQSLESLVPQTVAAIQCEASRGPPGPKSLRASRIAKLRSAGRAASRPAGQGRYCHANPCARGHALPNELSLPARPTQAARAAHLWTSQLRRCLPGLRGRRPWRASAP